VSTILEAHGLSKKFGGLTAVSDVNLAIDEGELHCLIGPNGAGKSTLFKLLLGTYDPSSGRVVFQGSDITKHKPYQRILGGMSVKMQVPSIFRNLPVAQNLVIALQRKLGPIEIPAKVAELLSMLELEEQTGMLAGELSHGQQQWLEIGMAMALQPRLLLLDEPTAGMSVDETFRTGELIKRLNTSGMTILVVEHDMAFIRQIAQRVTVLHLGRIFAQDTIDKIIIDPRVSEIYLGKPDGD
jgi:branched-chain amino acid transport system ATP-binding protein